MRKYSQLTYLFILILVCGSVALAAHQVDRYSRRKAN